MSDWYGTTKDYIHLKFGDMQKCYNFTEEFRSKHPNFCAEYELYWKRDPKCRFKNPLQIAQYVDLFDIPVGFYFNFTDTPAKNIKEVYDYILREYSGITYEPDGNFRSDYQKGLDGEEPHYKAYKVHELKDVRYEVTTPDGKKKSFNTPEELFKFIGVKEVENAA